MVGRKVALMSNFNPRSLVGNDMNPPIPVRCLLNFNPRSLVGNDQFQNEKKKQLSIFQSTFPRGERRFDVANIVWQSVFQSTFPRGERRSSCRYVQSSTGISIHVPSWGTTENDERIHQKQRFQSTFPRGERPCEHLFLSAINNFNPRSLVGNDGASFLLTPAIVAYFNPRSLVGNDYNVWI